MANASRLLLVSHRLPTTLVREGARLVPERSAGGVATGFRGIHERAADALWIGYPGEPLGDAEHADAAEVLAPERLVPVRLDAETHHEYYESFANGVLWPAFHYLIDRLPLA